MAEKKKSKIVDYTEPVEYFPKAILKMAFKEAKKREKARKAAEKKTKKSK